MKKYEIPKLKNLIKWGEITPEKIEASKIPKCLSDAALKRDLEQLEQLKYRKLK